METEQYAKVAPSNHLMSILWPGALGLQAIYVAAKLSLADLMDAGPKTVSELAKATHTHEPSLGRLLHALSSIGVFIEETPGCFRQSVLSETLRAGHPQSVRSRALMMDADFVRIPVSELERTIRTGQAAFESVFGVSFFEHLMDHPHDAAKFDAAVGSLRCQVSTIVSAYDFSQFEFIVDIGGGHSTLLAAVLAAAPLAHGVLYDLPTVIAASVVPEGEIAGRLKLIPGDFLETVPPGADAYMLRHVIHNWDDDSAIKILTNCRHAIRPGGRILILDSVLAPSSPPQRAFMDILMMVLTNGRERTESQFRLLLHEAGFSLLRVIGIGGRAILEGCPVPV